MGLSFYVDPAALIKLSGAARFFLAILRRRARSSGFGTLLCGSLRNYCGAQAKEEVPSKIGVSLTSTVYRRARNECGLVRRSWQDFSHELRILLCRVTLNADV